MKKNLSASLMYSFIAALNCSVLLFGCDTAETPPVHYSYSVLQTYPHDEQAFTQGLIFHNGLLYESTGRYGYSSLRSTELETGLVLTSVALEKRYFGEGLAYMNDSLIQLTWRSGTGFVYDPATFKVKSTFTYTTEGWGLTDDGARLIMSDGSARIYFLAPDSFAVVDSIIVHDNGMPVTNINELEYVDGHIFANIWETDYIAVIDPADGAVRGWIDLSGLLPAELRSAATDVLNGIAYDHESRRLFVTGKNWPLLFEILLVPSG